MKYKLVIFDFDGTLADSFPWALSIADQVADKRGILRIDKDQIENLRGISVKKLLKMHKIPLWKLPVLLNDVRRLMAEGAGQIPMFAGIEQLIGGLAEQGVRMGVVTSNSYENVLKVLGQETAARIDFYECSVGLFGKRGRFRKILKKSGIARVDTICIGDETRDIEAARKAKLTCGAVSWGYATIDIIREHSPDVLFASVDELAQFLLA